MSSELPHPEIYEPISHTGDVGIVAYGRDLPELFAHAAWAMFDLMGDATTIRPQQYCQVQVTARDLEDLLVRWLSELLYLYETRRFLCCTFIFSCLEPQTLSATVGGEPLDEAQHRVDTEIKAVTYHQIRVEQYATQWQAQVIFDL